MNYHPWYWTSAPSLRHTRDPRSDRCRLGEPNILRFSSWGRFGVEYVRNIHDCKIWVVGNYSNVSENSFDEIDEMLVTMQRSLPGLNAETKNSDSSGRFLKWKLGLARERHLVSINLKTDLRCSSLCDRFNFGCCTIFLKWPLPFETYVTLRCNSSCNPLNKVFPLFSSKCRRLIHESYNKYNDINRVVNTCVHMFFYFTTEHEWNVPKRNSTA